MELWSITALLWIVPVCLFSLLSWPSHSLIGLGLANNRLWPHSWYRNIFQRVVCVLTLSTLMLAIRANFDRPLVMLSCNMWVAVSRVQHHWFLLAYSVPSRPLNIQTVSSPLVLSEKKTWPDRNKFHLSVFVTCSMAWYVGFSPLESHSVYEHDMFSFRNSLHSWQIVHTSARTA